MSLLVVLLLEFPAGCARTALDKKPENPVVQSYTLGTKQANGGRRAATLTVDNPNMTPAAVCGLSSSSEPNQSVQCLCTLPQGRALLRQKGLPLKGTG